LYTNDILYTRHFLFNIYFYIYLGKVGASLRETPDNKIKEQIKEQICSQ